MRYNRLESSGLVVSEPCRAMTFGPRPGRLGAVHGLDQQAALALGEHPGWMAPIQARYAAGKGSPRPTPG